MDTAKHIVTSNPLYPCYPCLRNILWWTCQAHDVEGELLVRPYHFLDNHCLCARVRSSVLLTCSQIYHHLFHLLPLTVTFTCSTCHSHMSLLLVLSVTPTSPLHYLYIVHPSGICHIRVLVIFIWPGNGVLLEYSTDKSRSIMHLSIAISIAIVPFSIRSKNRKWIPVLCLYLYHWQPTW